MSAIYEPFLLDMDVVANLKFVIITDRMGDVCDVLFVFTAIDRQAWEFLALHQARSRLIYYRVGGETYKLLCRKLSRRRLERRERTWLPPL